MLNLSLAHIRKEISPQEGEQAIMSLAPAAPYVLTATVAATVAATLLATVYLLASTLIKELGLTRRRPAGS